MIWSIFVLISLAAVFTSFYSPLLGWILLILPEIYLAINYRRIKHQKINSLEKISEEANFLFKKYYFYFLHPYSTGKFASYCIMMSIVGLIMGCANFFQGFYYGIGLTYINWFLMRKIYNGIYPYFNVWNDDQRELGKEILNHLHPHFKK